MGIIPPFRRYCKGFSLENGTIFFACPGKNPTICRKAPFQGLKTSRTRLGIAHQWNVAQFSGSSEKHRKTHWCGSTQRLPCVKGAVMAVSRKAMTEGLSVWASSDPLSPSVRTGAAPLGQQGEPFPSSVTAAPCHLPRRGRLELRPFEGSRTLGGDCDRRESLERATTVCALSRNDMRDTKVLGKFAGLPSSVTAAP